MTVPELPSPYSESPCPCLFIKRPLPSSGLAHEDQWSIWVRVCIGWEIGISYLRLHADSQFSEHCLLRSYFPSNRYLSSLGCSSWVSGFSILFLWSVCWLLHQPVLLLPRLFCSNLRSACGSLAKPFPLKITLRSVLLCCHQDVRFGFLGSWNVTGISVGLVLNLLVTLMWPFP